MGRRKAGLKATLLLLLPLLGTTSAQFSFGLPNFGGNNNNNQDNNGGRQDPFGSLIGGFLGGLVNSQQRPPNNQNQGNPNQGNRPGQVNGQQLIGAIGSLINAAGQAQNQNNQNQGNNQGNNNGGEPITGSIGGIIPFEVSGGNGQNPFQIAFGQGNGNCNNNNGGCQHVCRLRRRRVRCSCNAGFQLQQDQRSCGDQNECNNRNGGCSDICDNSEGSFTCRCHNGRQLLADGKTCGSNNQNCNTNNGGCSQICQQTFNGVQCACQRGFTLSSDGKTCEDLDECVNSNGGCQDICNNVPGGRTCGCKPGTNLNRDGFSCSDQNECFNNNGGCAHFCQNTQGSFRCNCLPGYNLVDGTRCEIANRPTQPTTPAPTPAPTPRPTQRPTQPPATPPTTGGQTPQPRGCGANDKKSLFRRIVGGRPADPKDWPWMAALLQKRGNDQYCGGTLITDRHVLTAAHCMLPFSKNDIIVRLGEYDFTKATDNNPSDFDVVDIRMHVDYDKNTQENDIALLKLDRPSTFNQFVWPICLPPAGNSFERDQGYVIGWGTIYAGGPVSTILQEVIVPVWSQNDCNGAYPGKIKSTMMCAGAKAGGKDSCQGDSGGPYLLQDFKTRRWYVAGVVSWGIGCAAANKPGVYTRVNNYLDWIRQNAIFP